MTLGEKLKKLRTEKGFTQEELSEKLFVTRTAISKWESDRGYPNIDSLKAISKLFSVTVDELLSSDELLKIAEEDNKQKEKHFRYLVYALLDLSVAMLILLPFFAETAQGEILSVSLLTLTGVQTYLKIAYFAVVICVFLMGILTLIFKDSPLWQKNETQISLILSTVAVLIFIISSQPYAAIFAFVLVAIKALMLLKAY